MPIRAVVFDLFVTLTELTGAAEVGMTPVLLRTPYQRAWDGPSISHLEELASMLAIGGPRPRSRPDARL